MKHTEESLLALLERRYVGQDRGNGPAWAFIPKVRNAAGFAATRTIDAIAMSLWPSRGLELHGHEVKCSREDWLREMRDPAKAEAFTQLVDRWWLVAADTSIVQPGELPPTWGLMIAAGRGLQVSVQAPELPPTDSPWMPPTFLAALLRAACRTRTVQPKEVQAAVASAREAWDAAHADNIERWQKERDRLQEQIRRFEEAAGVRLETWQRDRSEEVGRALRVLLDGDADVERYMHRFEALADQAERLASELRKAAG